MGRFEKFTADYQIMSPEDMDAFLFGPYKVALGQETVNRIQTQYDNYQYYQGKQHRNEQGELVQASELEAPADLGYEPTRYATNYFKAIINRKARWQMGGKHSVSVPHPQIDPKEETVKPGYKPSSKQKTADKLAEDHEALLKQLWAENKMRTKLVQAARDRLIADRVVAKIVFNRGTGKLKWVFRPDTEFIPIYSDDDFEEMKACHFVRQKIVSKGGEEKDAIQKQTFTLEGEGKSRQCYIEEAVYLADSLQKFETITPKTTMGKGIDFIPVVPIEVADLLADGVTQSEVASLQEQNDILNTMNEDAIDSLKFEMFSMTAVLNAPEGTAQQMQIAPGAVIEARGYKDGHSPSIDKVEGGFRWKEAFKDQYNRVKGAMHEVSGLPQIVPQELNFGGLNGDALQVLFHDIISDTEEHWLTWQYALQELHEKSIKYLKARTSSPNFAYKSEVVNAITEYNSEINFVLPLPDNRKELVELLGEEMANRLESQSGALERLGVDNVKAKQQEIEAEMAQMMGGMAPYGEEGGAGAQPVPSGLPKTEEAKSLTTNSKGQTVNAAGEPVKECGVCAGSGQTINRETGEFETCNNCRGDGVVQVRQR